MAVTGVTDKRDNVNATENALSQMGPMLSRIDSNIRWAFFDGYQALRAASYEPSVSNGLPPELKPVQLGSMKSRKAYLESVQYLSIAEIRLAFAAASLGHKVQPPLAKPHQNQGDLYASIRCIDGLRQRLDMVSAHRLPKPLAKLVAGKCDDGKPSAYKALRSTDDALHSAFNDGTEQEPEIKMCRICTIRIAGPDGADGRCNTCTKYLYRNNKERPKRLDKNVDPLKEAKDAQLRRMARQEGFGHS